MSRLPLTFIALLAMLLGSSCVPSIHGIATEGNVIFRPELVGSWVPEDGDGAWIFENENDRGYLLTLKTQEGIDGSFHAALVELDGRLFLDLFPSDSDPSWPIDSFYGLHFLPVHTFMQLELSEDSLSLRMMDPSWMDAWLASNPDAVTHEKESFTVLTASTAELQALLPTLLDSEAIAGAGFTGGDTTAFTDPAKMVRGEMAEVADAPVEEALPVKPMPTTQVPTTP
jgi:hypothetical protein